MIENNFNFASCKNSKNLPNQDNLMSIYNKGVIRKWVEGGLLAAFLLLIISSFTVSSQIDGRRLMQPLKAVAADSIPPLGKPLKDSLTSLQLPTPALDSLQRADSIAHADSIHRADSVALLDKSSLDAPAFTTSISPVQSQVVLENPPIAQPF